MAGPRSLETANECVEKSSWNEPFYQAMNNNIIWVSWVSHFVLRRGGGRTLMGGMSCLEGPVQAEMGHTPTWQAHLISRFRIRACSLPTYSLPAHHIQQYCCGYKRQLCHRPLKDGMMEAINRKLQRERLIRQLPDSVEHIRNTPQHTAECCDPSWASIFLLWSQLRGKKISLKTHVLGV